MQRRRPHPSIGLLSFARSSARPRLTLQVRNSGPKPMRWIMDPLMLGDAYLHLLA
jgi:hypothetical protein